MRIGILFGVLLSIMTKGLQWNWVSRLGQVCGFGFQRLGVKIIKPAALYPKL